MAPQRGESPVDLFGEHGAGEFVREGHGGKRQKQVGFGFPLRRKAVVASQQEKQVLRFVFGAFYKLDEGGRIECAASGVQENFTGSGMALEQVEAGRSNFAHFADGVEHNALDELGGDGVGVLIARFAYEIDEEFNNLNLMKSLDS